MTFPNRKSLDMLNSSHFVSFTSMIFTYLPSFLLITAQKLDMFQKFCYLFLLYTAFWQFTRREELVFPVRRSKNNKKEIEIFLPHRLHLLYNIAFQQPLPLHPFYPFVIQQVPFYNNGYKLYDT